MIVNKYQGNGGGSGSGYTLPIASASRLGGIKVGDGLAINPSTGVLSASGSTGGDSHVLLASNAAPAGIQGGDVYASLIPAHDTDYDVFWTDTGSNSWQGDRNNYSKDIKIVTTGDSSVFITICNSPWDSGMQQFNISNGTIACDNPDAGWINVTNTRCQFTGWTEAGYGDKIFVDLVDGVVYAYSADRSKIWVYEAGADTDIYIGEIIYPEDTKYAIYQAVSGSSALTFVEYAKKEDLPASSRLLPEGANDNEMAIWNYGEWRLQNRAAVVFDGLVATGNYTDQLGKHQTLNRSSQWGMEWRPTVAKSIHAVSRQYYTIEADDNMQEAGILTSRPDSQGNVNLYYTTNEIVWDTRNRRWRPSDQNYGVNTYSHARYLITTGGQFGFVDDDDTNNTVMQIICNNGAIEGIENLTLEYDSEGGYYSGQTPAGNTLLAKDMGQNTFYICIGTDPATMQYEGTLTPKTLDSGALLVKGIPANNEEIVPTSPSIARIWKGSQAQYDALVSQSAVSETTFYIIL